MIVTRINYIGKDIRELLEGVKVAASHILCKRFRTSGRLVSAVSLHFADEFVLNNALDTFDGFSTAVEYTSLD